MSEQTQILSVHPFRRTARKHERELQKALNTEPHDGEQLGYNRTPFPTWANGVRVEKAGHFSWAVVATDHAGH